jgi:hypothetical protein
MLEDPSVEGGSVMPSVRLAADISELICERGTDHVTNAELPPFPFDGGSLSLIFLSLEIPNHCDIGFLV